MADTVTTHGRAISLRLFLEGIEVDVSQAVVNGSIGSPARASITIPVSDKVHKLPPRTLVHLFFFENRYVSSEGGKKGVRESDRKDPRQWRLLFVGETISYSFQKVGGLRQILLSCSDLSVYWNDAKLYWGPSKLSSRTRKRAVFMGATQLYRGKSAVTNNKSLIKLLNVRPATLPQLGGMLGGIVSLLESSTGVFTPAPKGKKFRGANDFMSYAEMRLHLTRMIGASEKDDTSSVFYSGREMKRYIRQVSSALKKTSSFLQLSQLLLGRMYHQWSSVPAPPYFPGGGSVKVKKAVPAGKDITVRGELSTLIKRARATHEALSIEKEDAENHSGSAGPIIQPDADPFFWRNGFPDKRLSALRHSLLTESILLYSRGDIREIGERIASEIRSKAGKNKKMLRKALDVVESCKSLEDAFRILDDAEREIEGALGEWYSSPGLMPDLSPRHANFIKMRKAWLLTYRAVKRLGGKAVSYTHLTLPTKA